MGATARRSDLPASAQACVNGVGATHTHPSWRSFAAIPLQPVPPDRYEITFTDVPVDARVSFRVNDQNTCDENPTGAVTRNIFVNDIRLVQNTTTPGNGDEPGFAIHRHAERHHQSVNRSVNDAAVLKILTCTGPVTPDSFVIGDEDIYNFVCRSARRHDEQHVVRPQAGFSGSIPSTRH